MNWILISVGVIFLISMIVGLCKGAIKIVVSLMTTVLTLALVYFVTPYVTNAVYTMTPIEGMIEKQIEQSTTSAITLLLSGTTEEGELAEESVRKVLKAAGVTEEELNALGITIQDIVEGKVTGEELAEYGISRNLLNGALAAAEASQTKEPLNLEEIPRDAQIAAINNSDMPDVFKTLLLTNNNETIYQKLGAEDFVSYISKYLTKLIINIVCFLFTFIIATILVRAIVLALDIISNLPVLGFVNRLAGGVLGTVGALIVVWVLFTIITLLYTTNIGKELYALIEQESILMLIYEYNPILKLATIFH